MDKKRWLTLLASCLINLCIGSVNAWSVFSGPMAVYLSDFSVAALTAGSMALVFTLANGVSPLTMISGGAINDKLGPKWAVFIGGLLEGGGMILTNDEEIAKKINKAIFPGIQGGPLMHVIAAKAVCFGEALKPEFKVYGQNVVVNAQALARGLMDREVKLVSGGTDNHLMLVDLLHEACTGKELEQKLDQVHITANKNTVPGETRSPFVTSGLRLGTPAVTTRGMGPEEMDEIAACIADSIFRFDEKREEITARVDALTRRFPLYE